MKEKLFREIDALYDKFLQMWIDVCEIESPSDCKDGIDKVGKYITDFAQAQGFLVESLPLSAAGNCFCITMNEGAGKQPVALSGHIDTVHAIGAFGYPAVRVDNKNIYGPGAADCKGGVIAALLAMTALKNIGFASRPVKLLLQSDEETSNSISDKKAIEYICRKAEDCAAFLNCESTGDNSAVIARKGVYRFLFEIKGKSVHSAHCTKGASAITEAAHKIIELEKMKDDNGVTCNCGLISGGTAENTVPDSCSFTAEIRFFENLDIQKAKDELMRIANKQFVLGTECTVTQSSTRPAMEKTERNLKLLERINEIMTENGLTTYAPKVSSGGSDAAEITVSGIPCVDSLGVRGGGFHTGEEYAVLSSLADSAKRLALLCMYI